MHTLCSFRKYTFEVTFYENVSFAVQAYGIRLLDCFKLAINIKTNNDVTNWRHDVLQNFFKVPVFLLLSLVTDPSFMSILLLVLEL